MKVKKFLRLRSDNSTNVFTDEAGTLTETQYGILCMSADNSIRVMIPWGRIMEVWYE